MRRAVSLVRVSHANATEVPPIPRAHQSRITVRN